MSEKNEDRELDEGALAALVRPSAAPPSDSEAEADADADADADNHVLDLRALAASMAPPAPEPEVKHTAKATSDDDAPDDAEPEQKEKKAEPAVVVPVAAAPERRGGGLFLGIAIGVAVAVGVGWFLTRGDAGSGGETALAANEPSSARVGGFDRETEPGPSVAEEAAGEHGLGELEGTGSTAAEGEPVEGQPVEGQPVEGEPVEGATEAPSVVAPAAARRGSRPRARGASTTSTAPTAMTEPASGGTAPSTGGASTAMTAETTMTPAMGGGLDNVLNMALGGRPSAGGTRTVMATEQPTMAPVAAASLPQTPSRGDVARTLGRLLPGIRQCAGDQVGLANATLMVRNNGSIASVSIGGSPFGGTPQGACMEGVIRRGQFPPFRQSTFRITYPFAIRPSN